MGRVFKAALAEGNFGLRRQAERDAALETSRRPGNFLKKALSPLRSASAVQKLRQFPNDAHFENKPYGEFKRPR
jgi:hypothetical protein